MAKNNQPLDVASWANNAHKLALVRSAQEEQERKHARKVMLLVAYFVVLIVLYAWLNNIA